MLDLSNIGLIWDEQNYYYINYFLLYFMNLVLYTQFKTKVIVFNFDIGLYYWC